MFDDLTKDAKRLLVLMYKSYLAAVESGAPRMQAQLVVKSAADVRARFLQETSEADVLALIRELNTAGYLSVFFASDRPIRVNLTTKTLALMEQRNLKTLADIAAFLVQFVP